MVNQAEQINNPIARLFEQKRAHSLCHAMGLEKPG
jgi:hypothetical protein